MKKAIKSIIKIILTAGVVLGLVLTTAESENAGMQFLWSFGWMAEMVISGMLLVRIFPEEFKEEGRA